MAMRLNKVMIIGYLGADPELRYTQSGDAVVSFRVAVDDSYKPKDGEKVERTDWFRVTAWRGLAEVINTYCRKGTAVYICGKLHERKWQDQDGNDRYTTEITAEDFEILKSANGDERAEVAPAQDRATRPEPGRPASSSRQAARPAAARAPARNVPQTIDSDEDLPF